MDVLSWSSTEDEISWWENLNGDGLSWVKHTIDVSFDVAIQGFIADIDKDGELEVLGAAANAELAWWDVVG